MRASCADLTLGQRLHAYLTSIAAAAVVAAAAAAAAAAAGAGAAAAFSSSAIFWSPPAAAAPAAGTGRLSNCSHTQAFFLILPASESGPLEGLLQGGMQGPSAGFGGQAGWPPPKPASFVLGLYHLCFIP